MAAMFAMSAMLEMSRMEVAAPCESAKARNKRMEGTMEGKACM